jgi:hypothetical protein
MKCTYILTKCTYYGCITRAGYGIAAAENQDGIPVILESYHDLSPTKELIEDLVLRCNNLDLDPIHLSDVVNNYLSSIE